MAQKYISVSLIFSVMYMLLYINRMMENILSSELSQMDNNNIIPNRQTFSTLRYFCILWAAVIHCKKGKI